MLQQTNKIIKIEYKKKQLISLELSEFSSFPWVNLTKKIQQTLSCQRKQQLIKV